LGRRSACSGWCRVSGLRSMKNCLKIEPGRTSPYQRLRARQFTQPRPVVAIDQNAESKCSAWWNPQSPLRAYCSCSHALPRALLHVKAVITSTQAETVVFVLNCMLSELARFLGTGIIALLPKYATCKQHAAAVGLCVGALFVGKFCLGSHDCAFVGENPKLVW